MARQLCCRAMCKILWRSHWSNLDGGLNYKIIFWWNRRQFALLWPLQGAPCVWLCPVLITQKWLFPASIHHHRGLATSGGITNREENMTPTLSALAHVSTHYWNAILMSIYICLLNPAGLNNIFRIFKLQPDFGYKKGWYKSRGIFSSG